MRSCRRPAVQRKRREGGFRDGLGGCREATAGSSRRNDMAQAIQKITHSAGCDISFNKLVLSQQNVRKTKADVSIEDLGEDIARRGL
jgi:hypothetical protein